MRESSSKPAIRLHPIALLRRFRFRPLYKNPNGAISVTARNTRSALALTSPLTPPARSHKLHLLTLLASPAPASRPAMGKKSGRSGGGKATALVLRVPMHCRCDGCADKIRAGVKDLTLHHGIEALDQSALWTKGDLTLVSTEDPERLRRRLSKATGKSVGLSIIKPQPAAADKEKEAAAAMQDLLRRAMQQGQYAQHQQAAAWTALQQPAAQQAYPWAVPQPEAYPSYHSAYPAATGGAWYAYPPAAQMAYGGGWHGHGPY